MTKYEYQYKRRNDLGIVLIIFMVTLISVGIGRKQDKLEVKAMKDNPPVVVIEKPIEQDYFAEYCQILPKQYIRELIIKASKKYDLPASLIASILFTESGFRTNALNNDDRGVAQINRPAHPEVTDEQAYNPEFAIDWMARKLRGDIDYFGGDVKKGVAAYNLGRGGAVDPDKEFLKEKYLMAVGKNLVNGI